VIAGVNGTDPFLEAGSMLRKLRGMGFSGIHDFPTVGLIDGVFRANLEETGMSYRLEVDLVRRAPRTSSRRPTSSRRKTQCHITEAGADMGAPKGSQRSAPTRGDAA
jgi:predicted TIM-barrel enzyme